MKAKLDDFVETHEGTLIFACFLASGLIGYVLMHFINFIP